MRRLVSSIYAGDAVATACAERDFGTSTAFTTGEEKSTHNG